MDHIASFAIQYSCVYLPCGPYPYIHCRREGLILWPWFPFGVREWEREREREGNQSSLLGDAHISGDKMKWNLFEWAALSRNTMCAMCCDWMDGGGIVVDVVLNINILLISMSINLTLTLMFINWFRVEFDSPHSLTDAEHHKHNHGSFHEVMAIK